MAVNTVSGTNSEAWQLISTTTMAGATSYTLSNIAGYKTLMVAIANGVRSSADYYVIRFNGDTAAGNYANGDGAGSGTFHYIAGASTTATAALVIINDADQSVPHRLYIGNYSVTTNLEAAYVDATPITSITIRCASGTATLNSGTIKLFGIAA